MNMQNKQEKPVVSVCMPAHNAEKTIDDAIRSIAAQNVSTELVLVDDCSDDQTAQAALKWAGKIAVRVLRNENNIGAAASRNKAVMHAQGEYVAFLDADDSWADGKLEKQLQTIKKTGAVLCCSGRELLTPQGEHTGRVIGVKEQITYADLLRSNCINCSSVLLPAAIAKKYPMQHEDSHEDYITWMRILRDEGNAVGINEPLLYYRLSNAGKSGSKKKSAYMTYKAYRYMGFSTVRSCVCFMSYAFCGVMKYARSYFTSAK